ncbi:MAG: tetratricopeptide repeat protein [Candidatus Odinarchaeota archaeon]
MPRELSSDIKSIEKLMLEGHLEEALHELEQLENSEHFSEGGAISNSIDNQLLRSHIMNRMGLFEKGEFLAGQVLVNAQRADVPKGIVEALTVVAESQGRLGKVNESLKTIEKGEELIRTLEQKEQLPVTAITKYKISLKNLKGMDYLFLGELEQALKCVQASLQLIDALEDDYETAWSLNTIGVIYQAMGELEQALNYFQKGLSLSKKSSYKQDMARSLQNIGSIYQIKGELDTALEHYKEGQKLFEELKNNYYIGRSLYNTGTVYDTKGKFDDALNYYSKSLEMFQTCRNLFFASFSLFRMINLLIENDTVEEAEKYLKQLEEINEKEMNKRISQRFRLGQASILKHSNRLRNKIEAQKIFQQVASEEVVDHELTVFAMLNLCELLLYELKVTGDAEVLEEVKNLSKKLLVLARGQNSYRLLAESRLLQSKLALLELDMEKARDLLTEAQNLAEDKGLQRLAMRISNEHDKLLEQSKNWDITIEDGISLLERLEFAGLEELVVKIMRKRDDGVTSFPPEHPILLLVFTREGVGIFSKNYTPERKINDQIIAGYLTAINMFSSEAFAVSGNIERIKHDEYTLLIGQKDPLLFCYVFKGQTYTAQQKLNNFIKNLEKSTAIWEAITRKPPMLKAKEKTALDKAGEFFQSPENFSMPRLE